MGQLRASIDVPAGVQAPGTARRLVSGLLPAWGMAELADDAAVVVSELVTNAWLHAQDADSFELELAQLDDGVQISLADGTAVLPVIRELDQAASAGRGMRIVIALAEAWGAEQHHGGKRVWVRLSR